MSEDVFSISITGHRPGDLRDATGRPIDLAGPIADFLERARVRARALGATTIEVITGGAIGVDQAVAAAVTAVRGTDPDFTWRSVLILPFPVEVQGGRWSPEQRAELTRLIEAADEVVGPVSETYAARHLLKRNELMVDRSAMTVAFWSGKRSGGTFACIRYALTKAKPPRPVYNALAGFAPVRL